MFFTRNRLTLSLWLVCTPLVAQDGLDGFLQTQAVVKLPISETYTHRYQLAQRFYLTDDIQGFQLQQIDLSHLSSLKIRDNLNLAIGLMYRFRDSFDRFGTDEVRLIQHLVLSNRPENTQFVHRWRAEQRIFPDGTLHRLRYRFSVDLPLQGQNLNQGESYLVVHTESLLSVGSMFKPQWDQRFTLGLGWLIGKKTVLLNSLEYRLENFNTDSRQRLFLFTSLNLSL